MHVQKQVSIRWRTAAIAGSVLWSTIALADTAFTVDPEVGNNAFTAVFDSTIGERITAVSSAIGCALSVDEEKLEGRAKCSVPLSSIRVDNDDTKTDHFRQWATNKKIEPDKCTFDFELPSLKVPGPVEPKTPVPFTTEGTFRLCGRERDDHKPEQLKGTIVYLPPGAYGDARTLRIRVRIEGFDRERYGVGPKSTPGWLARVQQLTDVVGTLGTIDVNLFATVPNGGAAAAKP